VRRLSHSADLKLVRIMAQTVLGPQRADDWLTTPNSRLGGQAPLVLASDRRGADQVTAELDRLSGVKPRP
jgi:uncharacterized protein (DUF2384 family)